MYFFKKGFSLNYKEYREKNPTYSYPLSEKDGQAIWKAAKKDLLARIELLTGIGVACSADIVEMIKEEIDEALEKN